MSHSRSKCMNCSQPPTHECRWFEGRARAWFCDKHWGEWSAEHADDIDTDRKVKGGEVGMKYGEDPKVKKADNHDGKKTGDGTEVGFFIPLSSELAEQFPSLGDNDKSPSHITFLYVGAVPKEKQELFLKTCSEVFAGIREPVRSHLEGLDYFVIPFKNRRVAIVRHRFDHDMSNVRWLLRDALQNAGFTVDDSFPLVYHPHTTLEYLDGFDAEYQGIVPEGSFTFNEIEIWGLPEVHKIPFGEPVQRVARNYMLRSAGLFEEPPAMFNIIWPWFREALAANVLHYLDIEESYSRPESDEQLVEWKILRQECHKYASEGKSFSKQQTKKFKVDLRGWKYTKDPKGDLDKLRMRWHETPTVYVTLKYGEFSNAGSWSPVFHIVELHIGYSRLTVQSFKKLLHDSEILLRHELGHAGQTFLNDINEVADHAGVPSKKLRDPEYDESGNFKKGWPGFITTIEHPLIDVEFYTDLKDAVADFMQQLSSIPMDRRNDFFRTFVYAAKNRRQIIGTPNWAFQTWKQKAPGKWKKAVAELVKELSKKGVSVTKVAKTFTLNPGDPVLYGKYKNKPGTIKDFKTDEKSGDPIVVVEPYPPGRKQDKEIKLFKIRQDDRPRDDAEVVQKVASRYISAAIGVADDYLKAYDAFEEQVSIFKESYAPGQYSTNLWLAWSTLWRAGRIWGDYIIDNLAIPRNQAKAIEMIVRAFSKPVPKTYDGGAVTKWRDKNIKYLKVLVEAAEWLTRSAETDVFKVGAFTVHNTLGLKADELEGVKDIIQKAVAALPRTGLSGMTGMAYGDIFLVGQLGRPKWAAWYIAQKDSIYLRPNMRGISQTQIARHLVHELGHRYWKKNPYLASAWVTYDTGIRYSRTDVRMPHVGDVLPMLVNNKQVRIESEDSKGSVLVDTKTGNPVGTVDRGKLYDWMRSATEAGKFPSLYAAKGGAEEHFCEALSLKAFGELKGPNLDGFDRVISGGSPESMRLAARYQEKKKIKTKDGDDAIVYVYSERQIAQRNKDKADRVEKLRKNLDKLRLQVKKDIKSEDPKTRLTALVVGLINDTYERVGNDESAKDGHVGVTGWTPEHVKFSGGKATFTYTGKSGVDHVKETKDPDLVRVLKEAVKDKKKGDTLFTYEGGRITAETVNEYLKPFDITAKDIRGLHANREMKERLKAVRSKGGKLPTDKKEREKKLKAEFKEALEGAAEAVGHEPATLKSQYLVPGLEDDFMKDGTVTERMNKKAIINIDNATDGMESGKFRGVSGLLSSLTYYETALMQDLLVHPNECIQIVRDAESDVRWYVLRKHVLNPDAVGELVAAGYLQERNDGTIRVSDIFEAKKNLYQYDLNIPGIFIPDEMKIAAVRKVATKSPAEKEDEAIRDLSRKAPSKKPPRHDLRNEHVDLEKEPDEFGAEGDRDLSLNYKRVASRWVSRIAKRGRARLDKKKEKQQSAEHEPGDTWQTEKGWAGKNPDGVTHSFKGDAAQEQAEAYAKGVSPEAGASEPKGKGKKAPEQKPESTPEVQPEQKLETPEDWASRISSPDIFNKIMKGLAHFEDQMSGVDDSYEIPDIPYAPTGLTTMGQVRELLSRKKELSKLVGKKGKKPPKKKQTPPDGEGGEEDFDEEGNLIIPVGKQPKAKKLVDGAEQMLTSVGATEDFINSMKFLPPAEQQEILDSFYKATQDVQISLEMLDESVDQDFIKEASQAYKNIRGGREVERVRGYDPGFDDEDEDIGELISLDRSSGDIKMAKSPEEIGRYLALAKIAPQIADPGRGVDDEIKSDKELDDLAQKSFNRFKNLSPELRAEAAHQMKDLLEGLPQDNPRREQLERTLDGLALASFVRGEKMVADKKVLRPDPAPGFRVLAKILDRQGKIDVLLGSMEHYESPESRQVVGEALDNLTGPEISEILGGESGPWKKLLKDVDWEDYGDAGQEEIKKMLRRVALDEMTTLQALMEAVAEDPTGDSPLSVEKLQEHMEKWRNNKKLPKKVTQAVDTFTSTCQSGDAAGKADCLDTKNRVEVALLASWLEELKRAGAELKPDNPLVAQIQDVLKTGDVSKLDMKYVPAGAQDVTVGG